MPFREHRYYTYIMASSSGTLYVGMTNCIEARARQHQGGTGSEFTRRYKVDRLVYFESFRYVLNAIRREKEIKGQEGGADSLAQPPMEGLEQRFQKDRPA